MEVKMHPEKYGEELEGVGKKEEKVDLEQAAKELDYVDAEVRAPLRSPLI